MTRKAARLKVVPSDEPAKGEDRDEDQERPGSRDFSQRALDVVRKATERHEEDED